MCVSTCGCDGASQELSYADKVIAIEAADSIAGDIVKDIVEEQGGDDLDPEKEQEIMDEIRDEVYDDLIDEMNDDPDFIDELPAEVAEAEMINEIMDMVDEITPEPTRFEIAQEHAATKAAFYYLEQ